MSDNNNDSTGSYLLDAIARFADKHEDFIDRHPKVDIALGFAAAAVVAGHIAVAVAVSPITSLRHKWKIANAPLKDFEPPHEGFDTQSLTPPYWQDLVFGDDRLGNLLFRLKGAPTIDDKMQKYLLQRSQGGLNVFPAHEHILKYGLNDSDIYSAARAVSRAIEKVTAKLSSEEFRMHLPLVLTRMGVMSSSEPDLPFDLPLVSREKILDVITSTTELRYFHDTTTAEGRKNLQHVTGAVYDWLREDVAPVVPNIFHQYKAGLEYTGYMTLERQPNGYDRQHPSDGQTCANLVDRPFKDLYEIFADGYKGTLPVYAVPAVAVQTPQP